MTSVLLAAVLVAQTGPYMVADDTPPFAERVLPAAKPTADYATAYARAKANGNRLVVIVAADWCPPCQEAKRRIAEIENKAGVEFSIVDYVRDAELRRRLMGTERRIPFLLVFEQRRGGWRKRTHIGLQTEAFYRRLFQEGQK